MKLRRLVSFCSSLVLSISSLFIINIPKALAATLTWDGGGADNNFSTAENWSGDVIPQDGDNIIIDNEVDLGGATYTNDIAGLDLNSITHTGQSTTFHTITGSAITLTAGITNSSDGLLVIDLDITLTANQTFSGQMSMGKFDTNRTLALGTYILTFSITGDCEFINSYSTISGSGSLVKTGTSGVNLNGANTFTGSVSINAGGLSINNEDGLGTTAGGTTVASGAGLGVAIYGVDTTIAEPITMGGTGSSNGGAVNDFRFGCGGGGLPERKTITFSGDIDLTANTKVNPDANNYKLTGALDGAYTLGVVNGAAGTLTIASSPNNSNTENGTIEASAFETKYEDESPATSIFVSNNETAIVTGEYGSTTVGEGGILKGTGTVGTLTVNDGGTLAPGLSPGCLNSGNLTLNGTFQVEIAGTEVCDEYDQTDVTGTVDVTGAELDVSFLDDFEPAEGDEFVIINNDEDDAVTGEMTDLPEGETFTVGEVVLSISYEGGDGNDVTLTVENNPNAPDTGIALLKNNPAITLLVSTLSAGTLLLMARRYRFGSR